VETCSAAWIFFLLANDIVLTGEFSRGLCCDFVE
jgi:hypothetical protein